MINKLLPENFPERLLEIPQTPKKLFWQGNLPDWNKKFLCVVGARRYSPYGKEACEKIISGLSGYPIIIVSGLALGIDTIAHETALSSKLNTIAFPGSGLNDDVLYPSANRRLAKRIIESGGCIFSEFEKDFRATPWAFPQRNRIMAGISHATLIVEAETKSGTLITARLATEYNRDVCTVPGSIFSKNSEGPHLLIRLGATPITNSDDLLQVLGFQITKNDEQNLRDYAECSENECEIIELLRSPITRDELIRQSSKSAQEINTIITMLEIKGLIKETLGQIRLS